MKVRKQENVDAFRKRIIETAEHIMKEEGIKALSIRKITNRLQYSPGIIYHYFKNKDEILYAVVENGYGEIVHIITSSICEDASASDHIVNTFRAYIKGMIARKEVFLLLMNANDEQVKKQVDILIPGITTTRTSMKMLYGMIEKGVKNGEFVCEHIELRAQVLWCATFGLIERIHKEQVEGKMQEQLIEEHIQMMLASLRVK